MFRAHMPSLLALRGKRDPARYEELKHVEELLSKRQFYAVGEIGIDLYWDTSTLNIQKEAFKYQIRLAKKYQLPIVIHCRDAFDEIFEVLELEKGNDLRGIFHCFTVPKRWHRKVEDFFNPDIN